MSSFTGKSVGTTIPLEIGVLTQLIFLNLYGNRLIGTIPSSLGNLTKLTELDLLMNSLTGTIPSLLGNLTQLSSLGLSFNQLNGTVPSIVGNLIKLTSLFLGDNQLTGSIPSTLDSSCNHIFVEIYDQISSNFRRTKICDFLCNFWVGWFLHLQARVVFQIKMSVVLNRRTSVCGTQPEDIGGDQINANVVIKCNHVFTLLEYSSRTRIWKTTSTFYATSHGR